MTDDLIIKNLNPKRDVIFDIRATYQCRTCSHYGKCHTCPPEIPTISHWKELIQQYNCAELYVLLTKYTPASFDTVRIESAKKLHSMLIYREKECFSHNLYWAASLVGGSCRICSDGCGETCRHPEKARVAMEGAGIDVISTCKKAGVILPDYPHPTPENGILARVGLLLVR